MPPQLAQHRRGRARRSLQTLGHRDDRLPRTCKEASATDPYGSRVTGSPFRGFTPRPSPSHLSSVGQPRQVPSSRAMRGSRRSRLICTRRSPRPVKNCRASLSAPRAHAQGIDPPFGGQSGQHQGRSQSRTMWKDATTGRRRHVLRTASTALIAVALLVPAVGRSDADHNGPNPPTALAVVAASSTSLTMTWEAGRGRPAQGFALLRDGKRLALTAETSYTFTGLSCGTTYTLGIEAFDSAGNRSDLVSIFAAADACLAPAPTPPPAPHLRLLCRQSPPSSRRPNRLRLRRPSPLPPMRRIQSPQAHL